jgi:hypothetical protein
MSAWTRWTVASTTLPVSSSEKMSTSVRAAEGRLAIVCSVASRPTSVCPRYWPLEPHWTRNPPRQFFEPIDQRTTATVGSVADSVTPDGAAGGAHVAGGRSLGAGVGAGVPEPVGGGGVDEEPVPVDDGTVPVDGTSDAAVVVPFGSTVAGASFTASAARVVFTTGFGRATPLASFDRKTRRSVPLSVAA